MSTIKEELGIGEGAVNYGPAENLVEEPQENTSSWQEVLFAKSADKSLGEYSEYALNFNNSEGMSHILRGLEGMMGSLNYALVDIFVGIGKLIRERNVSRETHTS